MIRSMTGFGRATAEAAGVTLSIELKTVNNRYLKVSQRLPESLSAQEMAVEKRLKKHIARGSVSLNVRVGSSRTSSSDYRINQERLMAYLKQLQQAGRDNGLDATIQLADVARLNGVVESFDPLEEHQEEVLAVLWTTLDDACTALVASREEEGAGLAEDLIARCKTLLSLNAGAEKRAPSVVAEYRDRLEERISKLLAEREGLIREEDLAREAAMFADKCDISEENQRLKAHCESMIAIISDNEGEAGRRLDFIAQEMLREANTMGSKANDAELTAGVLEMKAEIEKIKEQVQNVE